MKSNKILRPCVGSYVDYLIKITIILLLPGGLSGPRNEEAGC
jgi:hypothetical protein